MRFSIIVPVFETPIEYVAAALDSVASQRSVDSLEVVVLDDGSPKPYRESLERLLGLFESRLPISFFSHSHNRGLCHARNSAVGKAGGEWMVLLDADDILEPDLLASVSLLASEPALFYTDHVHVASDGSTIIHQREKSQYQKLFREWGDTVFDPFLHATFLFHCQIFHRDLFERLEGFRTDKPSGEEVDFHLRACEHLPREQIRHIPRQLYRYRKNPRSVCHDPLYYSELIRNIESFIVEAAQRRGWDVVRAERIGRARDTHAAHYQLLNHRDELVPAPWFDYELLQLRGNA